METLIPLLTLVIVAGCAGGLGYVLAPGAQTARANRATITTLAQKVESLAAQLPEWTTNMEAIAAQCSEVLDAAERRRKRAAASESKLRAREEQDGGDESQQQLGMDYERMSRAEKIRYLRGLPQ